MRKKFGILKIKDFCNKILPIIIMICIGFIITLWGIPAYSYEMLEKGQPAPFKGILYDLQELTMKVSVLEYETKSCVIAKQYIEEAQSLREKQYVYNTKELQKVVTAVNKKLEVGLAQLDAVKHQVNRWRFGLCFPLGVLKLPDRIK